MTIHRLEEIGIFYSLALHDRCDADGSGGWTFS